MERTEEQKQHLKLWVEALRSGKYQQTTGALHNSNGYCCLGVACVVAGVKEQPSENDQPKAAFGEEKDCDLLPKEAQS